MVRSKMTTASSKLPNCNSRQKEKKMLARRGKKNEGNSRRRGTGRKRSIGK